MFKLECDKSVAIDSLDHIHPCGTANDNTICPWFVDKITNFYNRQINFLDFGCAGGGLVKEFHEKGHIAVGLEGSDYSLIRKRAEWGTIPNNLFTCDVTEKFQLYYNDEPIKFDIITCWEVMEHIPEIKLPMLFENIKKHLKNDGYWIMSISQNPEQMYHVNGKHSSYWYSVFNSNGFVVNEKMYNYIDPDWARCANQRPNTGSVPGDTCFQICIQLNNKNNDVI